MIHQTISNKHHQKLNKQYRMKNIHHKTFNIPPLLKTFHISRFHNKRLCDILTCLVSSQKPVLFT